MARIFLSDQRVLLHFLALLIGEGAGLAENGIGDTDLANVMHGRGKLHVTAVFGAGAQLTCKG